MADPFSSNAPGLSSPATQHYTVTPSDSEDLPTKPRALYVAADGAAVIVMGGVEITYSGLVAGAILPLRADRVKNTNTTATLVAWV